MDERAKLHCGLDPIHNQGLRLCLGAFRTSNTESLYVEANEPSLHDRRQKLSLQYAIKLHSNPANPAYNTVFHRNSETMFAAKPSIMPPFGIRIHPDIDAAGLDLDHIAKYAVPDTPPWKFEQPTVIFDLTRHTKATTDPSIFRSDFFEIKDKHSTYTPIYTDGSKCGDRVAAAAAVPQGELKSRLPDKTSIFSAELRAILLALDCADVSWKTQFILFSDSLSSLQAIHNLKTDHPIVRQVLERHNRLSLSGKEMIFCWLPSHTGITGNDRADNAAKAALELPISDFNVCYTDFKSTINTFIHDSMQSRWDVLLITNYMLSRRLWANGLLASETFAGMKSSSVGYA